MTNAGTELEAFQKSFFTLLYTREFSIYTREAPTRLPSLLLCTDKNFPRPADSLPIEDVT